MKSGAGNGFDMADAEDEIATADTFHLAHFVEFSEQRAGGCQAEQSGKEKNQHQGMGEEERPDSQGGGQQAGGQPAGQGAAEDENAVDDSPVGNASRPFRRRAGIIDKVGRGQIKAGPDNPGKDLNAAEIEDIG